MMQPVRQVAPRRRPAPPAGFQSRFLRTIRTILDEGPHNTTHDFALLHALADHCLEVGIESGNELRVPMHELSERVIRLYWPQLAPWRVKEGPGEGTGEGEGEGGAAPILVQNTGRKGGSLRRAAVVRRVLEARREHGPELETLRSREEDWARLVSNVYRTLRQGPLRRLQDGVDDSGELLFQPRVRGRGAGAWITLEPGIGFCFRSFHRKVVGHTRSAWTLTIREINFGPEAGDPPGKLQRFLFGESVAAAPPAPSSTTGAPATPGPGRPQEVQELVHRHPDRLASLLEHASAGRIRTPIRWVAPDQGAGWDERAGSEAVTGEEALRRLGVTLHERPLPTFWPDEGPRWDALGRDDSGAVVLLDVRGSVRDLISAPAGMTPVERVWVEDTIEEVRRHLGAAGSLDWAATFFRLTSRLAHLHLLRELNGVEAWLVCVHLSRPGGGRGMPAEESEWLPPLRTMYRGLGLPPVLRPDWLLDVFVELP
jgi:hypothetical protein